MGGYRVLEAINGQEAVTMAAHARPHLILMDLSLPQIDGLAATRSIRQMDGMSHVPIIAISAHDTSDFRTDALAAGCNEYVTKPVDFDRLESLLKQLLAG
jgi:two-component system cell cycle response regulator DivK